MTHFEIETAVRLAGFTPTSLHPTVVTAERGVAGHPGWYRVLHFWCDGEWSANCRLKRPKVRSLTEWEYDPTPLSERSCLTPERIELWLIGVVSDPIDVIEVAALSEVKPSQLVA